MSKLSPNSASGDSLPVGDPWRPAIGRAVFGTLLSAGAFFLFTLPAKQFKPLYQHAPWANDPFDTVFSHTQFFVPLVAAYLAVQVSLCLKREPLPIARLVSMLRGCRVAIGLIAITLLSCWISLIIGANHPKWSPGATALLVALLTLVTALTIRAVIFFMRTSAIRALAKPSNGPDWVFDAVTVAQRASERLGPLRPLILASVNLFDREVVMRLRRRPVVAAVITSVAFGSLLGINQGVREGYRLSETLFVAYLFGCGMFTFLVLAGSYLGIVRSASSLIGRGRRVLDAGVAASIVTVAALAFRNSLWSILDGSHPVSRSLRPVTLGAIVMAGTFISVLVVESVLHIHRRIAD